MYEDITENNSSLLLLYGMDEAIDKIKAKRDKEALENYKQWSKDNVRTK